MAYMELLMVTGFYKRNDLVAMKENKKEGENVLNECILGS